MKIIQLVSGDNEENATIYTIGKCGIIKIAEHRPTGEGDKWFYDVRYSDGSVWRIFNPLNVKFETE